MRLLADKAMILARLDAGRVSGPEPCEVDELVIALVDLDQERAGNYVRDVVLVAMHVQRAPRSRVDFQPVQRKERRVS